MSRLGQLWRLAGGHRLEEEDHGPAQRTRLMLLATVASALLAAAFGAAIAGGDPAQIAANLYRMPLVVLLASAACLPPALLAWRLVGSKRPASDLAMGLAAGTFTGTLLLACLAPVVALYGHTSTWLGPVLAMLVAAAGVGTGLVTTWRAVLVRAGESWQLKASVVVPLLVLGAVHLATLTQLVAISSLMPEVTFLDEGLEGMAGR